MSYSKYVLLVLLPFCMITASVFGQESIVTSGGNASGSGGSVSYSAGQVSYNQYNSTGGWVEQGVQHAYEIYSLNISSQATNSTFVCKVYPNPSTDILILNITDVDNKNICYELFESSGKLLDKAIIGSQETNIIMSNYSSGTYILKINSDNTLVKTLKIIKN